MGVARVYQTGMPYNGVELAELDFEQTADTMYFAHLDHAPGKLTRTGHTDWTYSTLSFGTSVTAPTSVSVTVTNPNQDVENSGNSYYPKPAYYVVTAVDADTGEESVASSEASGTNDLTLKRNYNTITWSGTADRFNVYKANNNEFFGYIGTTEDNTFRDDNIEPALDRAPPEAYDPFPGTNDYPSSITLFEQRSIWGRTRNTPHGVWASRSAFLENFDRSRPQRADDSLSFTIIAGRVNSVNQLVSTTSLLALTSDSVFVIDGDGNGGILTGNSPPAPRRQIGRGSSRLPPLVVDNVVFYAPSIGISVRTIGYSFEQDGLRANDVSIFSPHFFEGFSIVSWCYSQEPRSVIWAARSDGKLLCFTWEQEQNVWGWTLCETDGLVKSVCSITENGEDRVYLIVEREIGGVIKRYVERMASHTWDSVEDSCYMDCAISAEFETPQTTFTGLEHLEGRTDVVGLIDGAFVTGLSVTNGTLTLPSDAPTGSKVTFGLPYQVDVELLPIKLNGLPGKGSNLGRRQQAGDLVLSLQDTSTIMAGIDADHLFPVKQRTDEAYGSPSDLMNGAYEVVSDNKAGDEIGCYIRQTAPAPFTLLGAGRDMIVDD